ncbi:MAG: AAA family ATPase [Bacteroidota bacterium]
MKIREVHIKNFKRFTDLKITGLSEELKLVLLIGANGSGKSSIFDAFDWVTKFARGHNNLYTDRGNFEYYQNRLGYDTEVIIELFGLGKLSRKNDLFDVENEVGKKFLGRSSLRIVPRIKPSGIKFEDFQNKDLDAPSSYIDQDIRFNFDVRQFINDINRSLREPVFKGQNADVLEIFRAYISPFNEAMKRIFKSSEATSLKITQFEDGIGNDPPKLIFSKGKSIINYDLLSHGEKQIIIILLNLIVRKDQLQNSIYFIDEMDAHLNTSLQYNLLKEITENWIPDNTQLWTASHSLGFIDYARESNQAAIIDFDDHDFDDSRILVPEPKDNFEVYEIAVGKDILGKLFKGMDLVFVENKDDEYYNTLALENTLFIPEKNKKAVFHKVRTSDFGGIIDRDFLTDEEVLDLQKNYPGLVILKYYSIENYMYHPDNLEEYYSKNGLGNFDKESYIQRIIVEKNKLTLSIITSLGMDRQSYPFFKEPEFKDKSKEKKFQKRYGNSSENRVYTEKIASQLDTNNLDDFYPHFSMKKYCTFLEERQNIPPSKLAQTQWFKSEIESLLKKI